MISNSVSVRRALVSALLLVGVASGCRCDGNINQRSPIIDVAEERIDFGTVQINQEHIQELRVYNAGAASLNIAELRVNAPFGVKDEVPLTIGVGQEVLLQLTFTPVEHDKRVSGELVIASDDPDNPEVTVALLGAGTQGIASADPSPLVFGDVYVGDKKSLKLTIKNGGNDTLKVLGAQFLAETPPSVTADLSPIAQDVPAGSSTETMVTFSPTEMSETIPGGIKLELDPLQGGELSVTFEGRGVQAIPRLCFIPEGSAMETCTAANAGAGGPGHLDLQFPATCDSLIYPPDGGTNPCDGAPYSASGALYLKNEGNLPVQYSMQYKSKVEKSCDGGVPDRIDFQFSNAPSPDALTWDVATTQLPSMQSDPKPWETAPVTVTYSATAACPDEAADQAQVFWTRQDRPGKTPSFLTAFLNGRSRLPQAVANPVGASGKPNTQFPFIGVGNRGIAEFQVTKVELYEVVTGVTPPAGECHKLDAGYPLSPCDHTNPISDCYQFGWAAGGDPNATAPHTIPTAPDGGIGTAELGTLVFSADSSANQNQAYCVWAVIDTTDPFRPQVISEVKAIRTQE